MICYPLQALGRRFDLRALENGALMEDTNIRPDCMISDWRLAAMHDGMDASINNMLQGGTGFPAINIYDKRIELAFDMGCHQEQRDLKSLQLPAR